LTLPGLEPQPLSRPARSQSLYRLRYPGSRLLEYDDILRWYMFSEISRRIRCRLNMDTAPSSETLIHN
jgi:hypothetical protein